MRTLLLHEAQQMCQLEEVLNCTDLERGLKAKKTEVSFGVSS